MNYPSLCGHDLYKTLDQLSDPIPHNQESYQYLTQDPKDSDYYYLLQVNRPSLIPKLIRTEHCPDKAPHEYDIATLRARLPYHSGNSYFFYQNQNTRTEKIEDQSQIVYLCELDQHSQPTNGRNGSSTSNFIYIYRYDNTRWKIWFTSGTTISWASDGSYTGHASRPPACPPDQPHT